MSFPTQTDEFDFLDREMMGSKRNKREVDDDDEDDDDDDDDDTIHPTPSMLQKWADTEKEAAPGRSPLGVFVCFHFFLSCMYVRGCVIRGGLQQAEPGKSPLGVFVCMYVSMHVCVTHSSTQSVGEGRAD